MNISAFYCMFSLQFSTICVQLHSCHLYMSLHLWYVHIESMTKELESKMCNFSLFWIVVRTGLLKFQKFLFQLNSSHQYNHFEVQHSYVMIKIKEVVSNWIFLHFTACSHYNFLRIVFSYIHVICTCLLICDMSIYKVWLKN